MKAAGFVLSSITVLAITGRAAAQGGLPPVPVPAENPITESKRVLGKMLFWDEQLSSDNSVACGTCHRPGAGGSDARIARHPGLDTFFMTPDDIIGSPGVARADAGGHAVADPIFGFDVQVTRRATPTSLLAPWSPTLFWDGRATGEFTDPSGGGVLIGVGGALESQSVAPIVNDAEMAWELRTWGDVTGKLASVTPLALASSLPADVDAALPPGTTYPALFFAAFGDSAITAGRIAFAIATYERTLVPDQTPWDRFNAGDPGALTPGQRQGWDFFRTSRCAQCHQPPFFSDNTFRNVGLRPTIEDRGRQEVTGNPGDRGRFRVPSLRNAGLRRDLFHNGRIADVPASINFYANVAAQFPDNQDPLVAGGIPVPPPVRPALIDFLVNGLTDPRVAAETFPFDRPRLASEGAAAGVAGGATAGAASETRVIASPNPFRGATRFAWSASSGGDTADLHVAIHDVKGTRVRMLDGSAVTADRREASWDGRDELGRDVAAGIYFVRPEGERKEGGTQSATRVVLVR